MVSQLDKKLLRDMWRLKGQVLAISLVVACGIATFVMESTAMNSLKEARDVYYERYRMGDLFSYAKRAPLRLTERLENIEGVSRVYPRINFPVTLDVPGLDEPAMGMLISRPEFGEPPLSDLYLRAGRMLSPTETDTILASEGFVLANGLQLNDRISAVINGRKKALRIVGIVLSPEYIYSIAPGQFMPDEKRYGILWMNRRALEAAVDMDGAFNNLVVGLLPGANGQDIMDKVDNVLKPYGGIDTIELKYQMSNFFLQSELDMLENMVVILPAIFLSVAAFLLNIVLSRQISTEREQIGMLKALGLSNWTVGFHYMKFAFAVVVVGTIIGTAMGMWLGRSITELYGEFYKFPILPFVFDVRVVVLGSFLSLIAAVIATMGGVRKIVMLPPAEAMMPEPPANYKGLMAEKLGVQDFFDSPGRMILRHLERRPLRAVLSVTGISLSLGILIAASFFIDSMNYMIDVQYNVANRENVSLNFNEVKPMKTLDEVKKLPGVLMAEPFRSVSVRLRNGNKEHRTGVWGVTADAQLKRMVDDNLQNVEVPNEGIMLSDKLARILDIGVGERLTIDVLEGRRPTRTVIVSGLVEQFVGTDAYMNLGVLNTLMGDPPVISGAALLTAQERDIELFKKVKSIPMISGAILKRFAMESMEKTMAETVVAMSVFNTLFAGLIAFGVVYNTARISLSERARELASMRVLGFRRGEISLILLGELAVLVLLSIPVGIMMGIGIAQLFVVSLDTDLFRIPYVISDRTFGYAVLVVVVASALSGWSVWRRVQNLDIISVLKTRE